ncbi:MAG: hypothetical protein KF878_37040 [Planctomycetes bacterium]|nr:hypothetical protein [Planctomycetota bacterium]
MPLVTHFLRDARALFALLVIVVASTAGCAAHPPPARLAEAPPPLLVTPGAGPQGGLTPVGRGEARAVLYAVVAFVIVGAFLVDLALLPFRHHRPFACCETVIHWCH